MPITLFQRKDSPYYWGRGTYLGQFICRSTKTDKKHLAHKIVQKWHEEIERSHISDPQGRGTFLAAAVSYMQAGRDSRFMAPLIKEFGEWALNDITQADIDDYASKIYPNPATRNRQIYTPISSVFKHAGINRFFKRPKGAGGRRLEYWFEPDELFKMFEAADEIDREFGCLIKLLAYTGCRLGEALNLLCKHVNLQTQEAFVPKTKNGRPRIMYLPQPLIVALSNHPRGINRSERVFSKWAAAAPLRFPLYALHNMVAERAGVVLNERCSFHKYRHTFATLLRRAGTDSRGLVATGAWKNEGSASRYAHVRFSEVVEMVNKLPGATVGTKLGTDD